MTGDGFHVTISPESAEALVNLDGVSKFWTAAPTMTRGSKRVMQPDEEEPAEDGYEAVKKQIRATKTAKKKKTEEPQAPVEEASARNIRRNSEGRDLIRELMKEIYELDKEKFPQAPCFEPDGKCKIKDAGAQMLTWQTMLQASPACFEAMQLSSQFQCFCIVLLSDQWIL